MKPQRRCGLALFQALPSRNIVPSSSHSKVLVESDWPRNQSHFQAILFNSNPLLQSIRCFIHQTTSNKAPPTDAPHPIWTPLDLRPTRSRRLTTYFKQTSKANERPQHPQNPPTQNPLSLSEYAFLPRSSIRQNDHISRSRRRAWAAVAVAAVAVIDATHGNRSS